MSLSIIFDTGRKFKPSPEYHVIKDYPERLEHFRSGIDKPYAYKITRHDGAIKGVKGKFDIVWHETENIDGELRVSSAMVFKILYDGSDEITDMSPRKLVANLFTTNDFTDDSFSRSFGQSSDAFDEHGNLRKSSGRTVEQGAICEDKTRVNTHFIRAEEPKKIFETIVKSKFADADRLLEILGHRAGSAYPDADPAFSKEELKQYKAEKLAYAKRQMVPVPWPVLKDRILADNYKNLDLPPNLSPKYYKNIGRTLTFVGANGPVWDEFAGLIFLLRTLKGWNESPLNLQLALASVDAFHAEVTPHDAKYGIVPPNGWKLENLMHKDGYEWIFTHVLGLYVSPQEAFCARLKLNLDSSAKAGDMETIKDFDQNAYFMLTEGFKKLVGLLGVVKRIARMLVVGDMTITPGLQAMIDEGLSRFEIDTTFYIPDVEMDNTMEDVFVTVQRIGIPKLA